ncbi:MAG: hypothetical protein HY280_09495 [Nitrospinae bacterium]|nr:hypothetical protein [Nitrospinota bacterium]
MGDNEKDVFEKDALLVDGIAKGDALAWEEFVRRYTGWVLYRSARWCEKHCPYKGSGRACGIKSVSMRMAEIEEPLKTRWSHSRAGECDEGMDTYIWILEQLEKRIMRYSGRNSSRLSTFVWAVLNSKEFYVDWLRWKYGRIF